MDSSLILSLPDDIMAIVSRTLSPRDLCNLSMCCRSLFDLANTDKVWLTQCDILGVVSVSDLVDWRKGVFSYKALCRFLISIQPLFGIWVHQNPELGNVVYVMPGFVSVVGCRIIPQELGPLGIDDGPILWAPVFEIIGDSDGSAAFFLHGRERENDYLYPGSLKPVDKACNVLLLQVEPSQSRNKVKLVQSKSCVQNADTELSRRICRSHSGLSKSQRVIGPSMSTPPFPRLAFGDRRKLLDIVTSLVCLKVPDLGSRPIFPRLRIDEIGFQKDIELLFERRLLLMQLFKGKGDLADCRTATEQWIHPTHIEMTEIRKRFEHSKGFRNPTNGGADCHSRTTKRKSLGGYLRNGLKQILGKSNSIQWSNTNFKTGSSSNWDRQTLLHDFLLTSDAVGLSLHASTIKLSSYRAWPNMHDSRYALYKLPMREPTVDQEYAGLWGGTFGWPPGRPTEDKPGKALFFLLLSYYEEPEGHKFLIATKILEGTHYVLHPNGSAMFIANIDEPSLDPFPFDSHPDSLPVVIKHAFLGDGIAHGYGFRYPGSKPGSLYVVHDGLLAFIWKESRAILTLQRLNLQHLLRKGERVPALPPIANFSYLTKSYSNVFAGFANPSSYSSSPRQEE